MSSNGSSVGDGEDAALWVFAYGSLIWRPAIPFVERRTATLRGFARRFWQGSPDHRGVPDAPGRVVTLVPDARARCTGVALRVAPGERRGVLAALDHRESGGFERVDLEVRFEDGAREHTLALTYVAPDSNPNFLGPAPLDALAHQVRSSHGPSGSNLEYLLELARALRELGADDDHVFELERLCAPDGAPR